MLAATALGVLSACPGDGPDAVQPDDCPMYADMAACEDGEGCAWNPGGGECVVDCAGIETSNICNEQDQCFWDGRYCQFGVS